MNKQSLLTDLKWVFVLMISITIGNIFMNFFETNFDERVDC